MATTINSATEVVNFETYPEGRLSYWRLDVTVGADASIPAAGRRSDHRQDDWDRRAVGSLR